MLGAVKPTNIAPPKANQCSGEVYPRRNQQRQRFTGGDKPRQRRTSPVTAKSAILAILFFFYVRDTTLMVFDVGAACSRDFFVRPYKALQRCIIPLVRTGI